MGEEKKKPEEEQKKEKNIHAGHRKRLRNEYIEGGRDTFQDYEVLELLLCYSIPRGNVNPMAHELINRFGTLAGVFEAPMSELRKVTGLGERTAIFLNMMPMVARYYRSSKQRPGTLIRTPEEAGRLLTPMFYGERSELVLLAALDSRLKLIKVVNVGRGRLGSANVSIRRVVEVALGLNAAAVVIAHNHPDGIALPSIYDVEVTKTLMESLDAVSVRLIDHLVVAEDDFVSMCDDGLFDTVSGAGREEKRYGF